MCNKLKENTLWLFLIILFMNNIFITVAFSENIVKKKKDIYYIDSFDISNDRKKMAVSRNVIDNPDDLWVVNLSDFSWKLQEQKNEMLGGIGWSYDDKSIVYQTSNLALSGSTERKYDTFVKVYSLSKKCNYRLHSDTMVLFPVCSPVDDKVVFTVSDTLNPDQIKTAIISKPGPSETLVKNHKVPFFAYAWHPKGPSLIFGSEEDSAIFMLNSSTGKEQKIISNIFPKYPLRCSPDGEWLFFKNAYPKKEGYFLFNLKKDKLTKIDEDAPVIVGEFSPDSHKIFLVIIDYEKTILKILYLNKMKKQNIDVDLPNPFGIEIHWMSNSEIIYPNYLEKVEIFVLLTLMTLLK